MRSGAERKPPLTLPAPPDSRRSVMPYLERYELKEYTDAIKKLEAENARLREELDKERERAETRGLALDAAVSSSCVLGAEVAAAQKDADRKTELMHQLINELSAAQATIEQMREALETALDHVHYWSQGRVDSAALRQISDILSTPANLDALHEDRARECERLASQWHPITNEYGWLTKEAAEHRARKQATKEEGK